MLRALATLNGLTTGLAIGCFLLWFCGLAWAQEGDEPSLQPAQPSAYDQALLRFNTNIESYASWQAFKTAVLAKTPLGTKGRCYEWTGDSFNPMDITRVEFQGFDGDGWRKTSGNGWRLSRKNREFIEYRINLKAGVLSRIEGVKPRFFFASTRRICEFKL